MSRPAPRKWRAPPARRGASAQQAAAAIIQAALAQAKANARGALDSADPEYLHQLRVGLRRYRSALRLFRDLLRRKPRRRLARRAREAMRPLGEARDWDVCIEWLESVRAPQALLRRAKRCGETARKALAPPELALLEPAASAWKGKSRSLERFRQQALPKASGKVTQRLRGMNWDEAEERHRLRIEVKRLRYATDFLGGDTRALEELQDTLGTLNDLAVVRRLVRRLDPPAGVGRKLAAGERRLLAAARRQVASLQTED
jgi:CHAD domain-containing protein